MEERLQKILARAGFGSRRSCEELIVGKRVQVNGLLAELGSKADADKDTILVDLQPIPRISTRRIYIALNKPRGVLSDEDPRDDRPTVRGLIPVEGHLFAVGRLDLDSEGLILMTDDGDLAHRLTHPRYEHEKEYQVMVASEPDEKQLAVWRRGVVLPEGHRTMPAEVRVDRKAGKNTWLQVIMREGRKRQIREIGATIGLPVLRIIRLRIGTLRLGNLKPGEWRNLTSGEIKLLKELSSKESASRKKLNRDIKAKKYPSKKKVV